MFKFLRVRRARTVVEQVSSGIAENIALLPPVDRAATLAIANAMLLAAAEPWGKDIVLNPYGLHRDVAVELVFELAQRQTHILNDVLVPLQKRNMDDVLYAQSMRQLRAVEVLISTVGVSIVPEAKDSAIAGWKMMWKARGNAEDAASVLVQFHKHAGSRPLPQIPGRKVGRQELIDLARTVPPFLRKKQQVPEQARIASKKAR